MEPLNSKDELGDLNEALQKMVGNLRDIVGYSKDISSRVLSSSQVLATATNETRSGSQHITETMNEMAEGSEQQAQDAVTIAESMNEFTESIDKAYNHHQRYVSKRSRTRGKRKRKYGYVITANENHSSYC